ncbi:MAG: hypothetical protein HQ546_01010 [Planctomycetes bacterium]|nr:hypothetical protein [Planctomycetota bacterium]
MIESTDTLLIASPSQVERIVESAPSQLAVAQGGPFVALEALADRPYRAVVVTGSQPALPRLLKAVRRLRPNIRVFALCSPSEEYDLLRRRENDRLMWKITSLFLRPRQSGGRYLVRPSTNRPARLRRKVSQGQVSSRRCRRVN